MKPLKKPRPWSADEDRRLIAMRAAKASEREIAIELDRSQGAISTRRLRLTKEGRCPKS